MDKGLKRELDSLVRRTGPDRVRALDELARSDDAGLMNELIRLATDSTTSAPVARDVGGLIAKILIRQHRVDNVPLHDFSGEAFLGYDATVAAAQRRSPP
jgi:hypothetical protein